ncbi:hypothetical protein K8I61_17590, partial [bacterium]|nr:hypothetical protein [bacterium]
SMLTAPNDAAFPAPKAPQLPANVARLRSLIATQQNAAFRAALWRAAIAAFAGVSEAEVLAALPPLSVALGAGDAFARPAGGDIYELAELAPGNAELQPGPGNAELQLGIPPRNSDSLPDRFDLARRARERQRGASFRWMTHAVGFAIAHEATLRAQIERQHEAIVAAASEVALAARRTGADRGIGDNVFLLTLDELSGRVPPPDAQTIASRRDALDAARRDPPPSVRFFRDGIEVRFARGETIPGARRGIGIGAGVITGTLNNPRDAAPGADAIDLIPDTDVRHLSTLTFSRPILALAGGIAGHLATVARELGVPLFVIDASGGDATFAPGMRVTIDFEKRTVRNA